MEQPRQLKTLDDLMQQAEHYAHFCMRNSGKMAPTLFVLGAEGPMMFVPGTMADDTEKDQFANTARLMCIAHAATACVMAMEAWAKFAKPGEKFDETEKPSEAIDRREMIVLMGEDRSGLKQRFLPIIRHDNGNFFNLGEPEPPIGDEMKGRFAQILSPKVPDKEIQEIAKTMLKVKGVKTSRLGNIPRGPGSRR